jgi:hypothetical protein
MKQISFAPVYLPASAGNILNCNITSESGPVGFTLPEPFLIVRHIHVLNIDTVAHVISLYKGATGASVSGTQFGWGNFSLGAQSYDDWYGDQRFDVADFLTGISDTASKVIITIDAEIAFQ